MRFTACRSGGASLCAASARAVKQQCAKQQFFTVGETGNAL
jgi:hypothetical protein